MKPLVVFYSYTGNTEKVAHRVAEALGAPTAEIRTVTPYEGDYDTVVKQGHREVRRQYRPPILPLTPGTDSFDTVILCTPVWWYTFAPAVGSFLDGASLDGKRIYPIATNGGWLGHTFPDIAKAAPGAQVAPGLDLCFDGDRQRTPEAALTDYIETIRRADAH